MTPYRISLNSFIRMYSLDSEKKGSEIYKRLNSSGGYDFYRTLSLAIHAHIKNRTEDEINDLLLSSNTPLEVEYNTLAYNNYYKRFGKKKGLEVFPKRSSLLLANQRIEVVCAPTFSLTTKSSLAVYHIWPTKLPVIDKGKASVACYILSRAFPRSNATFKFLDLTSNREYSTVNNTAAAAAEAEAQAIAWWLEQHV